MLLKTHSAKAGLLYQHFQEYVGHGKATIYELLRPITSLDNDNTMAASWSFVAIQHAHRDSSVKTYYVSYFKL